MGILSSLSNSDSMPMFSLNTGTHFDLATGSFLPGKDGHMILDGGLYMTTSVCGRAQTYKSSVSLGYFTRALRNYKNAEGICYDSEMSIRTINRLINISGAKSDEDLASRIMLYDKSDMGMEALFTMIKDICNEKQKQKKSMIAETPFVDAEGKYIKTWVPTIIAIDSFSELSSTEYEAIYDKVKLGDSKANTIDMYEGKLKTHFTRQLPLICKKYGIYIVMTAHVDDKIEMTPNMPSAKDVPMLGMRDKLKGVGSKFKFLSSVLLQTKKASLLQDSNKQCQYPTDYSSDVELQEVSSIICRGKNNVSGGIVNHISSQFFGIQEHLEYYEIIKDTKTNLIEGTQKQKLAIYDTEFDRKSIRALIASNYEFRRALEVLGQFVYVRNNWNIPQIRKMGYMEFAKKLTESKEKLQRILNSTGIWTFNDTTSEREYLSLLDIVALLEK